MFYLDTQSNTRHYVGRAFSYGGRQYTRQVATRETFLSLGFQEVVVAARPDDHFYVVNGPTDEGQYLATPRDLAELKTEYKTKTKQTAFKHIVGTDWYVIRLLELGAAEAAIPTNISSYRADVRTASDARCAEIDACASVADLEALVKAPSQLYDENTQTYSDNPAALTQFPEQPETGVYY